MAQWEKLRQLTNGYSQQLHELYDRDALPMDVRHYLATWIEKQEWYSNSQEALKTHSHSRVYLEII